ncbi:MAG: Methylamine utilization protein MauE [Actinomycetota bacterium]|nr:Methylamine utilization protein MauE [Actinomycetota bacterium]
MAIGVPEAIGILDLAGRSVVAGALASAAVLKLADPPGLRATLSLSRLTRPWVPQLSVALPATELLIAAALLTTRPAWWAALAAGALLVAFTVFLALDPGAGQGCACFGRRARSSRRAGIVRDVVLFALLLPTLGRGGGAARPGVPAAAEGAFALVVAVLITAGLAGVFLRDRSGAGGPAARGERGERRERRGRRRTGVPPALPTTARREAEPFDLPLLGGGRVRLADLLPGTPTLLFVETGCALCEQVLSEAAGRADVLVVVAGTAPEAAELAARHMLDPASVALDPDAAVADAYRLVGVPGACRINPEGILVDAGNAPVRRPFVGVDEVRTVLLRNVVQHPPPNGPDLERSMPTSPSRPIR